MKTLVLGDIHGRTCWKDIYNKENPDRVIFLGDYVSSHEPNVTGEQEINNLKDILDFKESNPNKVILLRGNHDVQHLTGDEYVCCYDREVGKWMTENKDRFMSLTQWVYEEGDIIFSHAGISKVWFNNHEYISISDINNDTVLKNFEFTPCKMSDYSGDSATQPLTWIRPAALLEYGIPNKTYVVGHTAPRKSICELYETLQRNNPTVAECFTQNIKVWLCDNLPDEYLVIENENFIVKKNDGIYQQDVNIWDDEQ